MIKTTSFCNGKYASCNTAELEKQYARAEELSDMLWFDSALSLFNQLAEKNYLPAVHKPGLTYCYGEGVPQSDELAFKLFKKAADANYPPSIK